MTKQLFKTPIKPSGFVDYKPYLEAIYQSEKAARPNYSYVIFSHELGLGTGNVSWLIIKGQRKLTRNTIQKVSQALGLRGYEKQYFDTMVLYTHASKPEDLDKHLQKLVSLKGRCVGNTSDEQVLRFYSQWHHAVIFELVGVTPFNSDPQWIQGKLNFHLSEREIQESLTMLETMGLIRFDAELKRHVKTVNDFETHSEVVDIGATQFHKRMIDLGKSSIENLPPDERDIGAVTIAVSPNGLKRIKQEVQAFRNYLMFIASQDQGASEMMQVNIQAFALTNLKGDREGQD